MKQLIRPLLLILFVIPGLLTAQEDFSIHKLHSELYGIEEDVPSRFSAEDEIIPLTPRSESELNKVVFGFLPDWEYLNGHHQSMDYNLLTHVACFDFMVSADGSMTNPAGWPWNDVINTAHTNGVKVILTAVTFDNDIIRALIDNSTARATLFQNIKTRIETYNLDGVNIDFEALYSADKGDRINGFMAELTSFIHTELPGKEVSFASPAINWGDHWKFDGLAAACDYLFIMGYSFAGEWSSVTSPNAPITGTTYTISNTIYTQYASVLNTFPEKLILGTPYYGLRWQTETEYENSDIVDFVNSPRISNSYSEIGTYGRKWSTKYKNSWYNYYNNGWYQVWYDDVETMAYKYDIVNTENLMGTGMWALGYDHGRSEMWALLDTKFGTGQSVPPSTPGYFYAEGLSGMINIESEKPASAYSFKIYYQKAGDTEWDSVVTTAGGAAVHGLQSDAIYYLKIEAGNAAGYSKATETLSAIPAGISNRVLLVNGFDREIGDDNTHDFVKYYSAALRYNNYGYSSASNEAVINGLVDINTYKTVIWILGEESTVDDTFNPIEIEIVKEYLQQGGNLFVSGAEIGWDIGRPGYSTNDEIEFYNNFLKAEYVEDAPNDESSTYYDITPEEGMFGNVLPFSFDDGTNGSYDVEYPDAIRGINGGVNVLRYSNTNPDSAGYAGVAYEGMFPDGTIPGRVVYFGFPFETIYDSLARHDLMREIMTFFSTPTGLEEGASLIAGDFRLLGNYPNPFNPETKIEFMAPEQSSISIDIFNTLGQKVDEIKNYEAFQGRNSVSWKPAQNLSSGVYIYSIRYRSANSQGSVAGKMNLVK